MSRRDFYLVGGLSIALAYANLVGPHRLVEQLYPNGQFVGKVLLAALFAPKAQRPHSATAQARGTPPTLGAGQPGTVRPAGKPPVAKPVPR